MDANYLNSLLTLLDDPDTEVYYAVSEKIITQGISVIPVLEKVWENSENKLIQSRLENLIHSIQLSDVSSKLKNWINSPHQDLLQGTLIVNQLQYPNLSVSNIEKAIDEIRKNAWLEINDNLTALEKVKVINHVIYDVHKYSASISNFFAPANHFLSQLVETKKGGPIILSILYAIVAQQLGLPVECVNLPKNFVLAYKDRYAISEQVSNEQNGILFYINPFSNGSVFGRMEIENFLKQQKIEDKAEYYLPCSNQKAIGQLVFNIIYSFERQHNKKKVEDFKKILTIIETI
ncbi:MAG TPA: transglutaminase-like domain-containing protein [Tenuifilaceae bacterium]|nr:transglutaminase-like domain-containing protein [Tenuifilaceae bacterium]